MNKPIHIFKFGSEWVAAENICIATKCFLEDFANQNLEENEIITVLSEAYQCPDKKLDKLLHYGEDGERVKTEPLTFRQELEQNIKDGIKFPCIFASEEY